MVKLGGSGARPPFDDRDKGKGGILIVDDSTDATDLFGEILRKEGYRVAAVLDPAAALEGKLPFEPDVILVDAKMPRMDGFELIRWLRDRFRGRAVRVVMLTGLAGREFEEEEKAAAGADEFLSKPVPREALLSCVERQFRALRAGSAKNCPAG